jgi:hypothetical protein
VAKLLPGQFVTVVVTEEMPRADFRKNPAVEDKLP